MTRKKVAVTVFFLPGPGGLAPSCRATLLSTFVVISPALGSPASCPNPCSPEPTGRAVPGARVSAGVPGSDEATMGRCAP